MTVPTRADVDAATVDLLSGLAAGDGDLLRDALGFRESERLQTGLGLRTTMVDIGGDAGNSTPIVRINNPTAYSVTTLGSSGAGAASTTARTR